jgi:hypothetical protein
MYQGKQKSRQGIALISVLFIAAVVLILASTFIYMVFRERQATTAARMVSDSLQMADAISERARLQMVDLHETSFLTSAKFVQTVYSVLKGGSSSVSKINDYVNTPQAITIDGKKAWWKIVDATKIDDVNYPPASMWIDIASTAETGTGVQTVIRRIDMGQSKIFDLAMLSEKTECIYCHLRVNGDVGALGDLRPGWGTDRGGVAPAEGWEDGWNSGAGGGGSVVHGDTFIAKNASKDATDLSGDPAKINGATFEGDVEENYKGNRLPKDNNGDNVPDFPVLDRKVGKKNTDGTISGGKIYTIPLGSTLASIPAVGNQSSLTGKYDGNVILEGTKDNPIILDGDLYFDGDVVIKGYVKGRGAIYSGRNTYVAGNINYIDPPENCAAKSNPDKCAQDAIKDKKDELRIAARGNVILGDYTEKNLDGSTKTWQELQAADYFKAQFGFGNGNKCFNTLNSDEVKKIGAEYKDIDGVVIPNSNVTCPTDTYSYGMRPGKVNNDGSFTNWLSDGLYKTILGEEKRTFDTWRYSVNQSSLNSAIVDAQFAKYNLSAASKTDILSHGPGEFDLTNAAGTIIGKAHWDEPRGTVRVMIDPAFTYEKQVTHVDAFMYANQRITGKTFNSPLVIDGGIIAKEIGILSPGVERPWYLNSDRYNFLGKTNGSSVIDCGNKNFIKTNFTQGIDLNSDGTVDSNDLPELSSRYQPESEDCALTINYDYRLRNGGLGYNLVSSEIGRTLSWQIADRLDQQVRP